MKHGSLFSGIGGFDLAAEWMGWQNVFHCEWNEFGQKVLHHHFPNSISYNDITQTDFTIHRGHIDILTGGFPCQPYSAAGKRLGKEDDRHLWPEMLRAIREIQPTWVVGENVLGLVNWNGGLVFDEVQTDLEAQGYEVQPYVLPACAVNAPHRRDRVWFVAYRNGIGRDERSGDREKRHFSLDEKRNASQSESERSEWISGAGEICSDGSASNSQTPENTLRSGCSLGESEQEGAEIWEFGDISSGGSDGIYLSEGDASNPASKSGERLRPEQRELSQQEQGELGGNSSELGGESDASYTSSRGIQGHGRESINRKFQTNEFDKNNSKGKQRMDWREFPTQSPICSRNDGVSFKLDGITFPKWRNESIKAYGNAVVPQVVYQIFKAIEQYNKKMNDGK
jgi:DNA (cytosine-5)-methyltransferase 1